MLLPSLSRMFVVREAQRHASGKAAHPDGPWRLVEAGRGLRPLSISVASMRSTPSRSLADRLRSTLPQTNSGVACPCLVSGSAHAPRARTAEAVTRLVSLTHSSSRPRDGSSSRRTTVDVHADRRPRGCKFVRRRRPTGVDQHDDPAAALRADRCRRRRPRARRFRPPRTTPDLALERVGEQKA